MVDAEFPKTFLVKPCVDIALIFEGQLGGMYNPCFSCLKILLLCMLALKILMLVEFFSLQ
jgi:hypothetical protein